MHPVLAFIALLVALACNSEATDDGLSPLDRSIKVVDAMALEMGKPPIGANRDGAVVHLT